MMQENKNFAKTIQKQFSYKKDMILKIKFPRWFIPRNYLQNIMECKINQTLTNSKLQNSCFTLNT